MEISIKVLHGTVEAIKEPLFLSVATQKAILLLRG